jgi:hypothetical protein
MDYITFGILIWNFSVVGIVSVFWQAPLKVNQMYLICISAFMVHPFRFFLLGPWPVLPFALFLTLDDLFTLLGYSIDKTSGVVHMDYFGGNCHLWYIF